MRRTDNIIHNGKALTEILRLHSLWLAGDKEGVMANFSGANFSGRTFTRRRISQRLFLPQRAFCPMKAT
jgi:hypothetical protein